MAGTGSAISFGNQTSSGTYTIVATNASTSCTNNMTSTAVISINALPTAFSATGGGSYCSGGSGVAVGLSGSQSGINYQLYNGASTVGSALAGTGSAISFGNQTSSGTYTIVATNASTSCTSNMSSSSVITTNPRPASSLSGSQIMGNCAQATITISVTGSGIISGTLSNGTLFSGSAPTITVNVNPLITTTYTVSNLTNGTCASIFADLSGSSTVTVPTGSAGVWTGAVNTDWFDCRNWADGKTPTSLVNVTIPNTAALNSPQIAATSSFAPSFGGIAKCKKLTVDNNTLSLISANDSLLVTGDAVMQNNGSVHMTNGGKLEVQGNWNNLSASGNGFKCGTGSVTFSGTATQTINSVNSTELFYNLKINKTTGTVNLNKNITVNYNLSLTNGVFVTGNNLFSWNNSGGSLTAPNIPFSYNTDSSVVKSSFIALCDASGTALSDTSGNTGFRVNNVGATETWFPVGIDYRGTPNRMTLQNFGTVDNFTVTLAKGDIGNTPKAVVERIWHVKESVIGGSALSMKLFFIKQDMAKYGISQDEVEYGFDYGDIHLIHKLGALFQNNSNGSDILNRISGYSYGTELYALYTKGVSTDNDGIANGINSFSPFSITNTQNIILPVTLVNLKAYQIGNTVKIDWTSLNENNVAAYEVERSANASNFKTIGTLPAAANEAQSKDYILVDQKPLEASNYYRIKAIDKDGKIIYSKIALVTLSKTRTGINVYPNPVTGSQVMVAFNNMQAGIYNVILYNNAGQKIIQKKIEHQAGTVSYSISLPAGIANGAYYISIQSDTIKEVEKLLIE